VNLGPEAGLGLVATTALLGSLHCVAMCGGFVLACAPRKGLWRYHAGRMTGYLSLGLLAGAIGAGLDHVSAEIVGYQRVAGYVLGGLLIALALRTLFPAGVSKNAKPSALTRLRQRLWARVAPRPEPGQRPKPMGYAIGLLSALLPCGWLWSFLVLAAATASPASGRRRVMAAFFVGTVPLLTAFGLLAGRLDVRGCLAAPRAAHDCRHDARRGSAGRGGQTRALVRRPRPGWPHHRDLQSPMSDPGETTEGCLHCGQPTPDHADFCCPGCRAVHEMLNAQGLGDFYSLRDRFGGGRPASAIDGEAVAESAAAYAHYDEPEFQNALLRRTASAARSTWTACTAPRASGSWTSSRAWCPGVRARRGWSSRRSACIWSGIRRRRSSLSAHRRFAASDRLPEPPPERSGRGRASAQAQPTCCAWPSRSRPRATPCCMAAALYAGELQDMSPKFTQYFEGWSALLTLPERDVRRDGRSTAAPGVACARARRTSTCRSLSASSVATSRACSR
jgi:sulfite exporter TauE/SafE